MDEDYIYCAGNASQSLFEFGTSDAIIFKARKSNGEIVWQKQIGKETMKTTSLIFNTNGYEWINGIVVDLQVFI